MNKLDIKEVTHKNIIRDKKEIKRIFLLAYNDNVSHVNQRNYISPRIEGYIRFDVLYFRNDVVSFSGLWYHDDWNDCVRAADRYYIFKKYRSNSLSSKPELSAASDFFIPTQFKTAVDWGLNPFISIQNIKKKKSIYHIKNLLKNKHNLNCIVLDRLRYTCIGNVNNENCWQNILTLESCKDNVDSILKDNQQLIQKPRCN